MKTLLDDGLVGPLEVLENMHKSSKAVILDLSKWNVTYDLDDPEGITPAEAAEIVDGVALRAFVGKTNGVVEKDPKFDEFYTELEQHPEDVRIAYGFLNKSSSWTKQYDKFLEVIDGKEFEILAPDAEHHPVYNDLTTPGAARLFAGITWNFTQQLIKDFPTKRIELYSNPATYQSFLRPHYPGFDNIGMWIAQWPYFQWYDLPASWLPGFRAWITGTFRGERQPSLPISRPQDAWEIWQLSGYTGVGEELGTGQDYLDVNISRRDLEDFREWSGLYRRWQPDDEKPPEEMTDAQKLAILWDAHPELH